LVKETDGAALVDTSRRLAPVTNAPPRIIKRLAYDDSVEVAAPVLQHSPRLTTEDLRQVASTKGNAHLLAISKREHLEEPVTDILVTHGDNNVAASLAENTTARFSASGLQTLVNKAKEDEQIAAYLIGRKELSADVLGELVTVHQNREAERCDRIASAQRHVVQLKAKNSLNDAAIHNFVAEGHLEDALAGISLLTGIGFDVLFLLLKKDRPSGFILVCKAVDLTWATISNIVKSAAPQREYSETQMREMYADFLKLSKANAERVLRFWSLRSHLQS
jgi:uncharacterized protein (DUF2336 family)